MIKPRMEFHTILNSFDKMFKEKNRHPLDDAEKVKEMFRTFIEPCHPFVFLPDRSPEDGPIHLEMDSYDEPLDLPYPCIHIEVMDSFISVPNPKDYAIDGLASLAPSFCGSFIAREVGPKEYKFLMNMYTSSGQPIMLEAERGNGKGDALWKFANSLLKVYLDRLNKEKVGMEHQSGVRPIGEGKIKKFYKLKPITYVSPKKYVSEVKPLGGSKEVDWSHRWEVRGHWRAITGIGKNREGEYIVAGFTWVMNHVKGPEDKPVIKKTYVVKGA